MAVDSRQNLDRQTKQVLNNRVDKGKEYEALQAAQRQLMAINAEQQQNLQVAKNAASIRAANNSVLSQAGSVAAQAAAEESAMNAAPVAMNPATAATLQKFGVGQPKQVRTQTHSQQVTKQNVVINNNTTTNTTNNVQAGGGGVQGREIAFRQQQQAAGGGMAKFKAWMSQTFAKQDEENKKRDMEFKRREWSLTRSANKMMKKLEDIGKTVGERMDPRKIGSTWQSQIKTLFMVFGFGLLASNWKKIILSVAKSESYVKSFLKYMGIGVSGRSQFTKDLLYFMGGDENGEKGVLDQIKVMLLGDKATGGKDVGLFGLIKEYFSSGLKKRSEAVKLVKFPELDLNNIGGTLKGLGEYLGNLLSVFFDPSVDKLKSSINSSIRNSESRLFGEGKGDYSQSYLNRSTYMFSGVDQGDYDVEYSDYNHFDANRAYDGDGSLNLHGSTSLAKNLRWQGNEAVKSGQINSATVSLGFEKLFKQAKKNGTVVVTKGFLENYLPKATRDKYKASGDIKSFPVKWVAVDKTDAEYEYYDGGKTLTNGIKDVMIEDKVRDYIPYGHNYFSNIATRKHGGNYILGETVGDVATVVDERINYALANSKRLKMVPMDDPREGLYSNIKDYFSVTPKVIQTIVDSITKIAGTEIDLSSQEYLTGIESWLEQEESKKNKGNALGIKATREYDWGENGEDGEKGIKNLYKDLKEYEKTSAEIDKNLDETWNNSSFGRGVDRAVDSFNDTSDRLNTEFRKGFAGIDSKGQFSSKEGFLKYMWSKYYTKLSGMGVKEPGKMAQLLTAQSAFESNYGNVDRNPKNAMMNGGDFNYSGITRDGVEGHWRAFKSVDDFIDYKVKLIGNNRYNALDGSLSVDEYTKKLKEKGYYGNGDQKTYATGLGNKVKEITKAIGLNPEDMADIWGTSHMEEVELDENGEKKGWLESLKDHFLTWMTNFGAGAKNMYEEGKAGVKGFINGLATGNTPIERYTGPITSEFTDYDSYLNNNGNLPKNLDYIGWQKMVAKKTGRLPRDLHVTDADAEEKRRLEEKTEEAKVDGEVLTKEMGEKEAAVKAEYEESGMKEAAAKAVDLLFGKKENEKTPEEKSAENLEEIKTDIKTLVSVQKTTQQVTAAGVKATADNVDATRQVSQSVQVAGNKPAAAANNPYSFQPRPSWDWKTKFNEMVNHNK